MGPASAADSRPVLPERAFSQEVPRLEEEVLRTLQRRDRAKLTRPCRRHCEGRARVESWGRDLTGSTTTRRNRRPASAPKTPKGRLSIRLSGARLAAALNGIYLHGGFAPNGATFPPSPTMPAGDAACGADGTACRLRDAPPHPFFFFFRAFGEGGHEPAVRDPWRRCARSRKRVFRPLRRIAGRRVLGDRTQPQHGTDVWRDAAEPAALRTNAAADKSCARAPTNWFAASGDANVFPLFARAPRSRSRWREYSAERASRRGWSRSPAAGVSWPRDKAEGLIGNRSVKVALEAAVLLGGTP